jgi:hypothetical protein
MNGFFHYLEENLNFMKERRLTKHYSIGFSDFEIQRFERSVTTFRSENLTNESSISDFKLFISEYEKRKGIQFGDYFGEFPDLLSLLD